ncbi:MAG: hypothetical protein INR71_04985 [Terriglobus roseus]|nr:hypothetical protein [Terriglobus roseus]
MATSARLTNGISPPSNPIQLSFPLPHNPQSRIHIHLTLASHHTLLFLAGSDAASGAGPADSPSALRALVCAMPARGGAAPPSCTTLYGGGGGAGQVDFAARVARAVARRTGRPAYVGNGLAVGAGTGMGSTVEEEMEGLRGVVEVVMGEVDRKR